MRQAEELRYLVLAAQREGNRVLAQALRPLGVTPAQAEVIRVLHQYQPLTLIGLGELLICETNSSPSRLVDRIVKAGLVARRSADQDRRHINLTLTSEGEAAAARILEVEDALYQAIDDAAEKHDPDQAIGLLRAFLAGSQVGEALDRRTSLDS